MNNIQKDYETDITTVFQYLLARNIQLVIGFKCSLSSSTQALFPASYCTLLTVESKAGFGSLANI